MYNISKLEIKQTKETKMSTWYLSKENAQKVISRLESYGRKVDHELAMIIYRSNYDNKLYKANSLSDVCEFYACDIWNLGAVR